MAYIPRLYTRLIGWTLYTKLVLNNMNPAYFLAANVKINEHWGAWPRPQLCTYDVCQSGSGSKWVFSLLQLLLLLLFSFKCSYCRQTGLFFFLWRTYVWGCSAVVNTLLCACKLGRGCVLAGEMWMGRRRCLEVNIFTVPRFLFGGKTCYFVTW